MEQKVWSFWLVPKEQDVPDNHGHEQARLFMKTLDASLQFRWRQIDLCKMMESLKENKIRLNKETTNGRTV